MTKKVRCSKCQRLFFTLTTRRDRTTSVEVPAYGLAMAPLDAARFAYVLTCTKCGNREVHVVPLRPPPLQSPASPGGEANALTGGIGLAGLPAAADEVPSPCPTCGYDLRATPEGCPQCGDTARAPS